MSQKTPSLLPIYVSFVLLIGLLALGQWYISGNKENQIIKDTNIINISGQQRTYSQEIAKYALKIREVDMTNISEQNRLFQEFTNIVEIWNENNILLVNYSHNTPQIQGYFTEQKPHFDVIQSASQQLIILHEEHHLRKVQIEQQTDKILENETKLLLWADKITTAYDLLTISENEEVRDSETVFLIIMLCIVFSGATLMYYFSRRTINRSFGKLEAEHQKLMEHEKDMVAQNLKLQKLYTELKESEKENQRKSEKLIASEAELKEQTEELLATNIKMVEHEAELIEVSGFQKAILDSAGLIIISTTTDGIITSFNPLSEKLLGYQAEEVVNKQSPAIFHDLNEIAQQAQALSKQYKTTVEVGFDVFTYKTREHGIVYEHEWTYIKKNGEKFSVSLTVSGIRNEQNEIIGYLGIASDISEKKKIEAEKDGFIEDIRASENILSETLLKLRENQIVLQRLSWVAERTTNAVIISDAKGIVEWVNEGFTQITGYLPEEIIGKKPGQILQGKNTDNDTVACLRQKIENKEAVEVDILNYAKDQREYWIHLSITPIFNRRNRLTNFIAIESDITERVREQKRLVEVVENLNTSREELKQQSEEVKATNAKLMSHEQTLAKSLNDQKELWKALNQSVLISITNTKGDIIEANDVFCGVSEYRKDELLNQNHSVVNSGFHPREFWNEMWQTIGNKKPWRGEICNRAKSGELYWVDSVINPIANADGEIYRYLSIRNLITERKKLEREFQNAQKILERKNKTISTNQKLLESKNKAISDSINYASRIQMAMLPQQEDYQKFMPEHFVFFKPRDVVSGDFYWFGQKDNRIIIVVADCTGHGIPGAMMSMIGNQLFHSFIHILGISTPEYILIEVNETIRQTLRQDQTSNRDGMDVALCVIDTEYKELEFAGAKNPLIYIQNGELTRIKGSKYPVGGYQGKHEQSYEMHTVDVSEPTTIYIYSDGYQDQFGGDGERKRKFMAGNFKRLLHKIHEKPLQEQHQELELTLADWRGKTKQIDDILVVGIKIDLTEKNTFDKV